MIPLPCPFAHKKHEYNCVAEPFAGYWHVICVACGAKGPLKKTRQSAISAWNRRWKAPETGGSP